MKMRNLLSIAFMLLFGFAMMIIGAMASNNYASGQFMIFFGLFAGFIASAFIWAIWNLDVSVRQAKPKTLAETNSIEKRKRDRLDTVLRDLSDADLLRLRQRLNDGSINDDALEDHLIGEDGELLYQEKRR